MTALGFVIAWRMESTQGFHSVMNFLLLPMWILSGALFPVSGAAGWMRAVILVNPLTYSLDGVRRLLFPDAPAGTAAGGAVCLAVTAAFAVGTYLAATWVARGHTRGDLQ
jgi:ABC-2 type transport system permease protein